MKNLIKIYLILFFFVASICASFSYISEEVVTISPQTAEVVTLKIPDLSTVISDLPEQNCEITAQRRIEDSGYSGDNEHVFESKFRKACEKFVNNKISNRKFNFFSVYLGSEQNPRAP